MFTPKRALAGFIVYDYWTSSGKRTNRIAQLGISKAASLCQ